MEHDFSARQTGRTTKMLERAIELAEKDYCVIVVAADNHQAANHLPRALDELLAKKQDDPLVTLKTKSRITIMSKSRFREYGPGGGRNYIALFDHYVYEQQYYHVQEESRWLARFERGEENSDDRRRMGVR